MIWFLVFVYRRGFVLGFFLEVFRGEGFIWEVGLGGFIGGRGSETGKGGCLARGCY